MIYNINLFNGNAAEWYCPFCQANVGTPVCSCLRAFFVYNDDDENCRLIIFYKAGGLIAIPRFGIVSTNGKELCNSYWIDENGNFSLTNELPVKENYRLHKIEGKFLKGLFPAPNPIPDTKDAKES